MYTPPFNAVHDEDELRAMVARQRSGWLVTVGPDGVPLATLLPVLWDGDRVVAHLARANPQWTHLAPDAPGLVIVSGPEAYVSPAWYEATSEHGRTVPTWNYTAVHLTGTITVHHDAAWLRHAVTALSEAHESAREEPWRVDAAPEAYIEGQLRGIVGIELAVTQVEGKSKLSQNRSETDRRGVVDGLRADAASGLLEPDQATQAADVAERMAGQLLSGDPSPDPGR